MLEQWFRAPFVALANLLIFGPEVKDRDSKAVCLWGELPSQHQKLGPRRADIAARHVGSYCLFLSRANHSVAIASAMLPTKFSRTPTSRFQDGEGWTLVR